MSAPEVPPIVQRSDAVAIHEEVATAQTETPSATTHTLRIRGSLIASKPMPARIRNVTTGEVPAALGADLRRDRDGHPLNAVVRVAAQVPLRLVGLRATGRVGRTGAQHVLSLGCIPVEGPTDPR